jgi:endonuclease III
MSNKNRGDRIQLLHKVVKKYYKPISAPEGRTVLETLIYACCLEDARYESADEAFHRLHESYFDWNEVRVTTVTELSEVLHNLPEPAAAAVRVKKNLQSIFETRYSFEIEDMVKMNQGKAIQELEKLGGISRFVLAYTIQNSLEGHAIPVSQSMTEILLCTGIVSDAEVAKGVAPSLERTIAKSKGLEFFSCLHQFAVDWKTQPTSKQLKAIFKEAGGVERPKVEPKPPEPKPAPKAETAGKTDKKAPTKAVAKKEEKPVKPEKVEKPEKSDKPKTAESKSVTKAPPKSAPKTAAKPTAAAKPAPSKSAPPAKPAKKAPAKKPTPAAKQVTKKKTDSKPDSKTTKRKPK